MGYEEIALRFSLAAKILRMPYGNSLALPADSVEMAWPPTGDYDRSPNAIFKALALAGGGNRPESSYTTIDRIKRDTDESIEVTETPDFSRREYIIHRKVQHCPKCRGGGWCHIPFGTDYQPYSVATVSPAETIVADRIRCDHEP